MSTPILEVTNLTKYFPIQSQGIFSRVKGDNKAVNGISFTLNAGETLGLVGESGCGKSTAGRTILKLDEPTSGSIKFEGEDITNYSPSKMKPLRTQMQMIFQDPYSSLNPRHTIGAIISASYEIQKLTPAGGVKLAVQELMERVGLPVVNASELESHEHLRSNLDLLSAMSLYRLWMCQFKRK
jgi:peptide/nickel transport system ATP-binding protein